jgi:hypothetical protein
MLVVSQTCARLCRRSNLLPSCSMLAGSVGSGVAADIFAPFERGTALGISSVPPLVGPVM